MRLNDFCQLRDGLRLNAAPADAPQRSEVVRRLGAALDATGLFHTVEVDHTDDLDQLVIAMAQFAPDVETADAADALESVWLEKVGYQFWSAHAISVDEGHVEMHAASRESQLGHFVTVHVVLLQTVPQPRPEPETLIPAQARPAQTEATSATTIPDQRRRGILNRLTGGRA